jgi:hypothetical protein
VRKTLDILPQLRQTGYMESKQRKAIKEAIATDLAWFDAFRKDKGATDMTDNTKLVNLLQELRASLRLETPNVAEPAITFDQDNFAARRASQGGAGVAYDPESLLSGEEIEAGLDYGDLRIWPNEETRQLAHQGELPTEVILAIAPRVKRIYVPSEDFSGYSDWHSAAAEDIY